MLEDNSNNVNFMEKLKEIAMENKNNQFTKLDWYRFYIEI